MLIAILSAYLVLLWHMFWPISLGFVLAGLVRGYVPTSTIEQRLGSSNPVAGLLALILGCVSSICNYAAISAGRSLVTKGASWPNTLVFMLASTNLGITILIAVVGFLGPVFLEMQAITAFVAILLAWALAPLLGLKGNSAQSPSSSGDMEMDRSRWQHACDDLRADVDMTRRDILIGLLIAASVGALVPSTGWELLFNHNTECWFAPVQNILVGSFITVLTFGCSIGNVALSAVMWWNGVPVAGVMAFLLAGLITIPMLKIMYTYYGRAVAMRLAAVLALSTWLACGLLEWVMIYCDIAVPRVHPGQLLAAEGTTGIDLTLLLNLVIGGMGVVMYWRGKPMGDM